MLMRTNRVQFLDLAFDGLTFEQVRSRLRTVTSASPYRYIVTPNVDHVVRAHREPELRELYEAADLCVCDSRILRLLARFSGIKLPLVAGSDLAAALFAEVIEPGERVAVIGGTRKTLKRLRARYPEVQFLHHEPPRGLRDNAEARRAATAFLAAAEARFAFIAVGSPQQEMIAKEAREHPGATGVALCIGAALEFLTGEQKRAPRVLQKLGFEWAHRLATNPRRLWRRYLVEGVRIFPIYLRWRGAPGWKSWTVAAVAISALAAFSIYGASFKVRSTQAQGAATGAEPSSSVITNLPPPDLLRPLSPQEAAKENAERPFVDRPDSAAGKFVLKTDAGDRERALTCLTQAVYYEAASEGVDGGRAVAQVVLNRMRHPGYPSSVCGVVYQGSDRMTGCQFTFTCDGSLLRPPVAALWTRSRKIAEEALAGRVFAPIGHATSYHADYVLPYWADSLDKAVQIGRHIFYRLPGSYGESRSFRQRYAGAEPQLPVPHAPAELPTPAETAALASALIGDNVSGPVSDVERAAGPAATLVADVDRPTLLADGQAPVAVPHRRQSSSECAAAGDRKQLTPMGANNMRSGDNDSGC
jgi:N-acetylglucosaminyldiphosphoundecaprenol N-acetyl-beta-D-mannosaminyltransferase